MSRATALTVALFITGSSISSATEQLVEIDRDGVSMVGTLELPDGEPAPVALLLHGFNGTRNELPVHDTDEGVFERTARRLAEAGYASLWIDFTGSGESGGDWSETTFQGQTADALAALEWLRNSQMVDGSSVALLGWSQGGLVAAHVAAVESDIRSVTLWAPVDNPMLTYAELLGVETIREAQSLSPDTPITRPLPWGGETTLNASFFQAMPVTSTTAAISKYAGPLQVIVGENDTVVFSQPASGLMLPDYHDGEENLAVFDTDHIFEVFNTSSILDDKIISTSINWMARHF